MNKLLLSLLAPAALFALNGPTIAPTGWDLYLNMGPNNNNTNNTNQRVADNNSDYVTVGGASGGRFEGILGPNASSSASTNRNVNLWCVDAQLSFNPGATYRTNALGFNEINGESVNRPITTTQPVGPSNQQPWYSNTVTPALGQRDVRYEDVKAYDATDPADNFRNQLKKVDGTVISTNDGALFRYRMAAYLLDQYGTGASGFNNDNAISARKTLTAASVGKGKYDPLNDTRNQAILGAIWLAMDTDFDTDNRTMPGSDTDTRFWFRQAAQYVSTNWTSTNLWSKWVVVSAWVSTCGSTPNNKPCYVVNSGDKVQTFLTETPEPGFYGLLATGISGLLWFAASRKKTLES